MSSSSAAAGSAQKPKTSKIASGSGTESSAATVKAGDSVGGQKSRTSQGQQQQQQGIIGQGMGHGISSQQAAKNKVIGKGKEETTTETAAAGGGGGKGGCSSSQSQAGARESVAEPRRGSLASISSSTTSSSTDPPTQQQKAVKTAAAKTLSSTAATLNKKVEEAKQKQAQQPKQTAASSTAVGAKEAEKREHQQATSNSGAAAAAITSAPPSSTKQEPAVHCLLCQNKLRLHPSLITGGGQIAPMPIEDEHEHQEESSSAAIDVSQPPPSLVERLDLPPSAVDSHHQPSAPGSPSSSSFLGSSQSAGSGHGNSSNLLELIGKSTSPLDVPMCKKCASSVADELQKQLADLESECLQYKQSLDQLLKRRTDNVHFDPDIAKRKLDGLKTEERDLMDQLAFLETEEEALNRELEAKHAERRLISERDEQLYRKLRDNHRVLIDQSDEQRALKLLIRHAEEQNKRLGQTNVLDMCFHIWVDGEFGTISGFRLGRLKHELVEWNEINAALGQTTFLLKVIAERLSMDFVGFELVPCGNSSFIRVQRRPTAAEAQSSTAKVEELPLFGSGGWRPFGQPGLDKGLVAFMDCFIQVEQRLKQYFPPSTQLLPYRMVKDKIVDKDSQYLVKMQLNSEERWTKAMKCLLLNLKRVLGILITLPTLNSNTSSTASPPPPPSSHSQKQQQQQQGSPRVGSTRNAMATPPNSAR